MTSSAKDGDPENEWADDDGRTVTSASPDFEIPPDVPLPVSMPPGAGPTPAPSPVVPKPAPMPASVPKMPVAASPRPAAGTAPRAPMPGPMPGRKPTITGRGAMPVPMPARPQAGAAPISTRTPSQPRIPLAPPPARPEPARAPAPAPSRDDENEASTSVLDPSIGAPLIAKMDELANEASSEDEADGDGPTMAGAPVGAAGPAPAPPPPAKAVSPLAQTAFALGGEPEESTRTVPRDELFRANDAHVIVGADAVGDEATMAVAPDAHGRPAALAGQPGIGAAFAATFAGMPPSAPAFPEPPTAAAPFQPMATAQGIGGPMPAPPPARPPQQSWPDSGGYPIGPGSNPMMATAPLHGHAPSGPYALQQQPAPIPRPGMVPTAAANNAPWPAPPNTPRDPKARMQLILLVVVGVICVSIFGIGIYLFASTMKEPPRPAAPARSAPVSTASTASTAHPPAPRK